MSFQAQFVGICKCGCGGTISRDEWINYCEAVEGYVLEGHEQRAVADRHEICQKCYMSHAGECF